MNVRNCYYGRKLVPMGKISATSTLSGGPFLSGRCFSAKDASTAVCQWPACLVFPAPLKQKNYCLSLHFLACFSTRAEKAFSIWFGLSWLTCAAESLGLRMRRIFSQSLEQRSLGGCVESRCPELVARTMFSFMTGSEFEVQRKEVLVPGFGFHCILVER